MITRSEQHVAIHQQYQESLQATVDWLNHMKEKLSLCSDSTGDRTTIQNKLDRLQVGRRLGTELQWVLRYSGDPPLCPSLALQWGPLTPSARSYGTMGTPLTLSLPQSYTTMGTPHPLCTVLRYNGDPPHPLSAPVLHYNGDPSPPLHGLAVQWGPPSPSLCPSPTLQWGPPSCPLCSCLALQWRPLSAPVLHHNGDPPHPLSGIILFLKYLSQQIARGS